MNDKFDVNDVCCDLDTSIKEKHMNLVEEDKEHVKRYVQTLLEEQHTKNVERAISVVRSANAEQMKKVHAILFN